ncbi:26S proteasome non-ATPase regulatory subunit 6-like [Bacillus rossius redtenbacheri]|uniref:26S proteasome non-ATPase regulatory subunit 6-like n=1 Tax=Bacillus rossius redtenbacheri TaxID=93214 RepID=UPI002FDE4915
MTEELEKPPPAILKLAKMKFVLTLPEHRLDNALRAQLLEGIVKENMAPYYKTVCADLGWPVDEDLLKKMSAAYEEELARFDARDGIDDEDDHSSGWRDKLDYLCSMGDREGAERLAGSKLGDRALSTRSRLHAWFALFRSALLHGCDRDGMRQAVEGAEALVAGGAGDWGARNKLKAYRGLYALAVRDYDAAARLLLDCVPTFESHELACFEDVARYATLACMLVLPRGELARALARSGEMAQALADRCPALGEYFRSLHECRYADFFASLAGVGAEMRLDPLLHPHYRQYVRGMRLRAYDQSLRAYSSLGLRRMGETFGVSEDFVEREVARFVADGRLRCRIDKVARAVVTQFCGAECSEHGDEVAAYFSGAVHDREVMYQKIIKHGDNVLNRTKKLARVIDF